MNAYDATHGRQTTALSFIVNRPAASPASGWSARRSRTGGFATRLHPTRRIGRPASATRSGDHARAAGCRHERRASSECRRPACVPQPAGGTAGSEPPAPGPDERARRGRCRRRTTVDLLRRPRASRASTRCWTQLDRELVGLRPVKTRIREIAALLLVDRLRRGSGSPRRGRSCTCASPAARAPARPRSPCGWPSSCTRLGYVRAGHLVAVTRDDLVGQYVGHTAPKTKEVIKRAMGGVLFIDEAYYLYRAENERDYGQEAIEILLQVMENQRDDLVVILAGYKDRMDTSSSPTRACVADRAPHRLPDYYARRADGDRRADGGRAQSYRLPRRRRRPSATTWGAGCAAPVRERAAASATRSNGPGCGRRAGCRRTDPVSRTT